MDALLSFSKHRGLLPFFQWIRLARVMIASTLHLTFFRPSQRRAPLTEFFFFFFSCLSIPSLGEMRPVGLYGPLGFLPFHYEALGRILGL